MALVDRFFPRLASSGPAVVLHYAFFFLPADPWRTIDLLLNVEGTRYALSLCSS